MASSRTDVIVLGAGIVGVSAALHLQARGRSVAIVDRPARCGRDELRQYRHRPERGGLSLHVSRARPARSSRAALNRDPRAHIRYCALPSIAPFLWRYFLASSPAPALRDGAWRWPRWSRRGAAEHRAFARAAGAEALLREGGWIKVFRTARGEEAVLGTSRR